MNIELLAEWLIAKTFHVDRLKRLMRDEGRTFTIQVEDKKYVIQTTGFYTREV